MKGKVHTETVLEFSRGWVQV